jgi:SAM-dependent methyltransferase
MNSYRWARRTADRILRAIQWTRRQMLISCDHIVIVLQEARNSRNSGWHFSSTRRRQERAYKNLIAQMHCGGPRNDSCVAVEALDQAGLPRPSLLELRCGSGYYADMLGSLCKSKVCYTGLAYPSAMTERARRRYPNATFICGDTTAINAADRADDIVLNGVSLMHILDFEKAIAEDARVAGHDAISHSMPVLVNNYTVHEKVCLWRAGYRDCIQSRRAAVAIRAPWPGGGAKLAFGRV